MTSDSLNTPYVLHYLNGLNEERVFASHDYYEILLIKQGELDIRTPGHLYHSDGSTLVIIPPHTVHCNVLTGASASYVRYIFFFTEAFCASIPDMDTLLLPFSKGLSVYSLNQQEQKQFLDTFDKLYRDDSPLHARILLQSILYDIGKLGDALPIEPDKRDYIQAVANYISTHYADKLVAAEIAKQFGVSRTKLLTDFQKNMHYSFGNTIMRERIAHAKKYLLEGKSITETAELCGFSSDTHLRYCFHVIMNMTPSEYRKKGERLCDE